MAFAPDQCHQDPPGAEQPELRSFLKALLLAPIHDPSSLQVEDPTTRRWDPEPKTIQTTLPFLDRHPEFHPFDSKDLPVRRIKRLSRSVPIGWRGIFQSMKMRRPMRHLSGIEREALRRCEVDPEITSFVEHPATMQFGARRIIPSLYVCGFDTSWFMVCCKEATASRPANEAKWKVIGKALAKAGYGFEVFTELHARTRPRADNVADLLRTRWDDPVGFDIEQIALEAARNGSTIGAVRDSTGLSRAQLLQLVRRHILRVDLDRTMANDAAIAPGPAAAPVEVSR